MSKSVRTGFSALAILFSMALQAQVVQGRLMAPGAAGQVLRLLQARGASTVQMDSTVISQDGFFRFDKRYEATGFYQLALNDSDVVNMILDKREPLVDLQFNGLPLDENMVVTASRENERLLELLYVTRETSAIQVSIRDQRKLLRYSDTLQLRALDRIEQKAILAQEEYLQELAADSAKSYFARTFVISRALELVQGEGPMAVAAVYDFSDPELMRSTSYDMAVMTFLRNIDAVAEEQFVVGSDTLMGLAAHDPSTRAYMLEHLIDLFSTYGPEVAAQHLIDRYVANGGAEEAWPAALLAKVEGLMAVSVGKTAPDVDLNDHGAVLALSDVVKANRFTALFFYSSTCEHCHAEMPGLKNDLRRFGEKGFDVVGIALDVDSAEFVHGIREHAIPWKCYSEFNGWGSKPAQLFQVKGTPTFFLLDDKMKIVAKPRNAEELGKVLDGLYAGE